MPEVEQPETPPSQKPGYGYAKERLDLDGLAQKMAQRDTEGFHAQAKVRTAQRDALPYRGVSPAALEPPESGLLALQNEQSTPDADPGAEGEVPTEVVNPTTGAISSLSDLASTLEIDMDTLLDLRAATKIDGQESAVSLREALSSFRQQGHITRQSQEFAKERETARKAYTEGMEKLDARLAQNTQTLEIAKKFILKEEAETDWAKLRADDPQDFVMRRFDFQTKIDALNKVIGEHTATLQLRSQEHATANQAWQKEEHEKLLSAAPELVDRTLVRKEVEQITDYMNSRGYSPQEIGSVVDHRHFLTLRDAARYAALRAQGGPQSTAKTVASVMHSAPRTQGLPIAAKAVSQARAQLKRDGSDAAVAALLAAKRAALQKRK